MSSIKFNQWLNPDNTENYKIRAWVSFNGSGTVAIKASGNVSSITDLGPGSYRINFAVAMPDTNYAPVFGGGNDGVTNVGIVTTITSAKLVASCQIATSSTSGGADTNEVSAFFVR